MGTTKKTIAGGQPQSSKPATADPLNVNARLYAQLGKLLDDMEAADREERMSMPQRIAALVAIGRIQVLFANLRKLANADTSAAGSEVRRYASAFAAPYGARRSTGDSGSGGFIPANSFGDDGDDDGPDAA